MKAIKLFGLVLLISSSVYAKTKSEVRNPSSGSTVYRSSNDPDASVNKTSSSADCPFHKSGGLFDSTNPTKDLPKGADADSGRH